MSFPCFERFPSTVARSTGRYHEPARRQAAKKLCSIGGPSSRVIHSLQSIPVGETWMKSAMSGSCSRFQQVNWLQRLWISLKHQTSALIFTRNPQTFSSMQETRKERAGLQAFIFWKRKTALCARRFGSEWNSHTNALFMPDITVCMTSWGGAL